LAFIIGATLSLQSCEPIADVSPLRGSFGFEERNGSNLEHRVELVGEIGVGD